MLYSNVSHHAIPFGLSRRFYFAGRVCSVVPGGLINNERESDGLRGRLSRRADHPVHESPYATTEAATVNCGTKNRSEPWPIGRAALKLAGNPRAVESRFWCQRTDNPPARICS